MADVYRRLAQLYGYTPQQISEMTLEQQLMMLSGEQTVTFANMQEYTRWLLETRP